VDGDRQRDHEAELLPAPEGDADADALSERMNRHHADDQEHRGGIGSADGAEVPLSVTLEQPPRDGDENRAPQQSEQDTAGASVPAFPHEARARPGHGARGQCVGAPERRSTRMREEEERQRPQACRQRGAERRDEDGAGAH
jgi:hypothetical protein